MTIYLCDTGPLLCFAQFPQGPGLFQARYSGRVSLISDVDNELRGLCNSSFPPVARAANRACGKAFNWIPRERFNDESIEEEARVVREVIDTFRNHPKGSSRREAEDWAEAVAIVVASRRQDCVLIVNDSPAREAAKSRGVGSVSARTVLNAMERDGAIPRGQASSLCAAMVAVGIDPGE